MVRGPVTVSEGFNELSPLRAGTTVVLPLANTLVHPAKST